VASFLDRAQRPDGPGQVLAERTVTEVPALLLAETAELGVDERRGDLLALERAGELLDGGGQLADVLAERLDECASGRWRELEPGRLGALDQPRFELLALDLHL